MSGSNFCVSPSSQRRWHFATLFIIALSLLAVHRLPSLFYMTRQNNFFVIYKEVRRRRPGGMAVSRPFARRIRSFAVACTIWTVLQIWRGSLTSIPLGMDKCSALSYLGCEFGPKSSSRPFPKTAQVATLSTDRGIEPQDPLRNSYFLKSRHSCRLFCCAVCCRLCASNLLCSCWDNYAQSLSTVSSSRFDPYLKL